MNEVSKIEPRSVEPAQIIDPMVSMIERIVLNPDADLDKLERMLALKRDHDRDNARIAFSAALSEARAKIPPIIKDATVDFTSQKGRTHYKHETLAGIAKQIDPILSAHGLSYRFRTDQTNGSVRVTCIIEHAQGHSEETSLSGSPDTSGNKNGFQAVGSAVTYLQRYTLKAALGLSAEIDDDGNAAVASGPAKPAPQREQQNTVRDWTAVADNMVRHLRGNFHAVVNDPNFKRDLANMQRHDVEAAARVEAEIATQEKANQPDAGDDLMDKITY